MFEEHTLYGTHFSRVEMGVIQESLIQGDLGPKSLERRAEKHGLKGSVLSAFMDKIHKGGQEIL